MSTSSRNERAGSVPASNLPDGKVVIGRVSSPHGVRGELTIVPLTDFPERFQEMDSLDLYREGVLLSTLNVRRIRFNEGKDSLILESDLGDRDEAAALSGALVLIDAEDRVELPEGHFWIDDLIGLRVEDMKGRPLGTVKDILTAGASETYEILGVDGRVHYVPAAEEFVRDIDLDLGRICIALIEGLWD